MTLTDEETEAAVTALEMKETAFLARSIESAAERTRDLRNLLTAYPRPSLDRRQTISVLTALVQHSPDVDLTAKLTARASRGLQA